MNDPNTTPAVRSKIQAYMSSDIAKAKFDNQYVAKEANAIAQRTAKNANAIMGVAVKNGDLTRVNELILSQGKEVFRTPEQVESLLHQATYNNLKANALDPSKTPNELTDYSNKISRREDLSSEEKSKLMKEADGQKTDNKKHFLANMSTMMHDPQVDVLFQDGVDDGYMSKRDVEAFKKKQFGDTAKADPNLGVKLADINRKLDTMTIDEANVTIALLENQSFTTGNKAQDVLIEGQLSDMKEKVKEKEKIYTHKATYLFTSEKEEVDEIIGNIVVEEKGMVIDPDFEKNSPAVRKRAMKAIGDMAEIQTTVRGLLRDGLDDKANETYAKKLTEWKAKYQKGVFAGDLVSDAEKTDQDAVLRRGTSEERQMVLDDRTAAVLNKMKNEAKRIATAKEEAIETKRVEKVREEGLAGATQRAGRSTFSAFDRRINRSKPKKKTKEEIQKEKEQKEEEALKFKRAFKPTNPVSGRQF